MNGRHVFLASSPRHALLAAAVALGSSEGPGAARAAARNGGDRAVGGGDAESSGAAESRLYVVEHLPRAAVDRWVGVLREWEASPFGRVEKLAGDWRAERGPGESRRAAKARMRRANRARLERDLAELRPDAVWVGCDTWFEAQRALAFAKALDPRTRGIALEDGTAAYARTFREGALSRILALRRLRDLVRRVTYGPWWRGAPVPGASAWIDEAWVAFPELVLPELRAKEVRELPVEPLRGPAFADLARRATRALGGDPDRLAESSLVLALTRSTVARFLPGYAESVERLCDELLAAGLSVALKYHPRETDRDFVPLGGREGVDVVPGALPVELLLALLRRPDPVVVGDVSTALLSARWIRPEARVVALRPSSAAPAAAGRYLERELAALSIEESGDPAELAAICKEALAPGTPGTLRDRSRSRDRDASPATGTARP